MNSGNLRKANDPADNQCMPYEITFTRRLPAVDREQYINGVRRLLWFNAVVDTPELEDLRQLVESQLSAWETSPLSVTRLDGKYL